jgi:hypothetical protein
MTADKRARSKSGQQIGRDNTDRLKAYLDSLQLAGLSVPQRNGRPNLSAIAAACGFDRQVLYHNPGAATLLSDAVEHGQADNMASPHPECAGPSLEERLAARAEIEDLREKVLQLEERNTRLRHFETHVLETGRRVS